ncbi:uncharacterized protein AC631_02210 [Debaryomyces fabryi]|uniref:Protein BZZ1 n=1 Tax=Debaryomyces fabryi TaxID=58627 RepID=A0A0V1Q0F0_9ASCO|nr:uncharacterized protein AC631_02210 [Debaryomyces fabryi]KSA01997.1 hypothetical protein AC631_02210 [Debaryomyces fabryi]CUM51288.1 unnamed protein product [Debaryomyces fabryi]
MSLEEISIGNDLKDSFKPTSKWVNNGINWINDIEEFYRERATIEKEYASRLLELCKKHFEKKAKISTLLSVGDEPQITPGSLESASLVLWNEVLTQTEAIAEEKVQFSREINTKLGDNLLLLKNKTGRIAKQIETIDEYLVSEKTKTEEEVNKAKKHYDSLCESTESARQKTEKSSSEKYQQKLQEKEVAMNIGKNEYLIKINIANRLKDKYFYQDVPELLDYFQELNESRVGLLNKLLKNASIIERNSNDRIKEKLHVIDSTIDQNNPKLDVAMFIKHNISDWKEPQDFYFIPCAIWHDDESLITKEPELTELKRRLNICSNDIGKFEDLCIESKQSLEEVTAARKAELSNLTLKFDTKLNNSLLLLQRFLKTDSERIKNEVEIEVIQNFAGNKDLSYVEVREKKKSKFGFLRGKKQHNGGGAVVNDTNSDAHSLHTVKSGTSQKSHAGLFNIRRNRGQSNASSASAGPRGKALYQYDATGDDEASIGPGEQFDVVDEDDGSGWTMIRTNQGHEGLVPTAYIEVSMGTPAAASINSGSKKKGPSVAPKRGAKRVQYVEALYDYQADGDDELTITAGDRIALVQADTDGSGWTEGELNGVTGMFPTSYVKDA